MSKDKGGKNIKKAASTETKKSESDYQSGKKSVSKAEPLTGTKKK
ncbi:hypothetical protein [Desertivirga xinjiangensis]|nr:hypothetical protein [Pedobacter xinjiangensis]